MLRIVLTIISILLQLQTYNRSTLCCWHTYNDCLCNSILGISTLKSSRVSPYWCMTTSCKVNSGPKSPFWALPVKMVLIYKISNKQERSFDYKHTKMCWGWKLFSKYSEFVYFRKFLCASITKIGKSLKKHCLLLLFVVTFLIYLFSSSDQPFYKSWHLNVTLGDECHLNSWIIYLSLVILILVVLLKISDWTFGNSGIWQKIKRCKDWSWCKSPLDRRVQSLWLADLDTVQEWSRGSWKPKGGCNYKGEA